MIVRPMEEPEKEQITETCLNCGTPLSDRFCPHCGQDRKEFKRSVWSIGLGFIETFTDFDNKLLKSLVPLLFRPGFLTKQYLAGKRKSYLNPIQMYAFFSFVFFLLYFYLPDLVEKKTEAKSGQKRETVSKVHDSLHSVNDLGALKIETNPENTGINFDFGDTVNGVKLDGKYYTLASYDSTQKLLPKNEKYGFWKNLFYRKVLALNQKAKENQETLVENMLATFEQNLPNLVIFLLPFFALIMKFIYVRRKFYFVEHIIFVIHLHCFAFILFCIYLLWSWLIPGLEIGEWVSLILGLYAYLSMKSLYNQSYGKTLFKFCLLCTGYSITLGIGLIANIIFAVFLID